MFFTDHFSTWLKMYIFIKWCLIYIKKLCLKFLLIKKIHVKKPTIIILLLLLNLQFTNLNEFVFCCVPLTINSASNICARQSTSITFGLCRQLPNSIVPIKQENLSMALLKQLKNDSVYGHFEEKKAIKQLKNWNTKNLQREIDQYHLLKNQKMLREQNSIFYQTSTEIEKNQKFLKKRFDDNHNFEVMSTCIAEGDRTRLNPKKDQFRQEIVDAYKTTKYVNYIDSFLKFWE